MWDISIYLHPFSKFQRLAPHVFVFLLVWCISLSLQKGTLLNCFHLKVHAFCKDLDGGDIIIHRPLKRIHRAIIQTKYEIIRNQGLKMDQVPFEVRPQKLQSYFWIGTNPSAASLVGLYPPASRYRLDPQYPPAAFKRWRRRRSAVFDFICERKNDMNISPKSPRNPAKSCFWFSGWFLNDEDLKKNKIILDILGRQCRRDGVPSSVSVPVLGGDLVQPKPSTGRYAGNQFQPSWTILWKFDKNNP